MKSSTFIAALLPALVLAQRPTDVSICDYYTGALLKDNNAANQYTLLTLLVNTVVIGNYSQVNTGVTVPGILAPGVVNGEAINLLPYFNGCLLSSNRGGPSGVSVNFLDGGGAEPLTRNLPANDNTSNQFGYGTDGFPAFQGFPSMYNVHKFMSLDSNQLAYFGQQVALSALSFGVTQDDVNQIGAALQTTFGYRCSPPVTIVGGPQLESICDNPSCPLDPAAQCGLYPDGGSEPTPAVAPQCMSTATMSSTAAAATTTYANAGKGYDGGWTNVYATGENGDYDSGYTNSEETYDESYNESYDESYDETYTEEYYEEDDVYYVEESADTDGGWENY